MLTIKDLPQNEELDRAAMGAVRGGTSMPGVPASVFSVVSTPAMDTGFQSLIQSQSLGLDQSNKLGALNVVF